MSKTFSKFALAAGMVLAMAFTLSCSPLDDGDGGGSSSSVGGGDLLSSSSTGGGGNPSSSSVGSQNGVVYGEPVNYEGDIYPTVVIGTQTWFAKNLNYDDEGSKCYRNDPANCAEYGRLYDWSTAMNLPSSCNENSCTSQIQPKHRGICPSGWHIPSNEDWDKLSSYVQSNSGCSSCDAKLLKATSGWDNSDNGNGTDDYGFSALPGGFGSSIGGYFANVGIISYWCSASEHESYGTSAYHRKMTSVSEYVSWGTDAKSNLLLSVRCLQD
jgi:uncharacterized protein (TIGR02145 family)